LLRERAPGEAERDRVRRGCCCIVAGWVLTLGEAERECVRMSRTNSRRGARALRLLVDGFLTCPNVGKL